jgi:hypothetical protein
MAAVSTTLTSLPPRGEFREQGNPATAVEAARGLMSSGGNTSAPNSTNSPTKRSGFLRVDHVSGLDAMVDSVRHDLLEAPGIVVVHRADQLTIRRSEPIGMDDEHRAIHAPQGIGMIDAFVERPVDKRPGENLGRTATAT